MKIIRVFPQRFRSIGAALLLFALCSLFLVPSAHAQEGEVIRRFDVQAELQADRTLKVTEVIEYDFGQQMKHGIYRLIPVVYDRSGAKYRLRLNVDPSTMNGGPVGQLVTNEGSNIRIRLGDPNEYVSGRRTYTITYTTNRAINDFLGDEERELYWNVTGNGWEVPIEEASFTLIGPAEATKTICFTGRFGSTVEACEIISEDVTMRVTANERLESGEGLTIAVRYPADAIAGLPRWQIWLDMVLDNIWLLMPILVFLIMYGIWYRFGKEPAGRGTVIAHYEEPHGLPPAILAALLDQGVSQKAVTATLLDLARRGYMKIKIVGDPASKGWFSKKASYHFAKAEKSETGLLAFERTLLDGLFDGENEVSLEDKTDGSFWTSITSARHQIFTHLKSQGYFRRHPQAIRTAWMTGGILFGMFFAWLGVALGWLFSVASVLSGLIIIAFGWLMPQKTKKGSVLAEEAEGFKLFLSVTERDRLNFTDAPERKPEQFARFLPAAVAFGVEEKWGKQFEGMMVQPPSYVEGAMGVWSAGQYVNLVDSMHSASSSSLYHSPSSGGSGGSGFSGGGSGGGGGGGGGGSW